MARKATVSTLKDRTTTEAKLIEAAKAVFSQMGYEGATTRMIAQKAGINQSLISRYFDGKYGLLIALIKKDTEDFHHQKLNYPMQANVEAELLCYGKFLLDKYLDSVNLIKVCMIQFLSDPKFLKKFRDVMLNQSKNSEILSRFEILIPEKKFDTINFLNEIEIHALGTILRSFLIAGEKENEIHKSFEEFLVNYSKHINVK